MDVCFKLSISQRRLLETIKVWISEMDVPYYNVGKHNLPTTNILDNINWVLHWNEYNEGQRLTLMVLREDYIKFKLNRP